MHRQRSLEPFALSESRESATATSYARRFAGSTDATAATSLMASSSIACSALVTLNGDLLMHLACQLLEYPHRRERSTCV
jgi:hypothetical protein